MYGWTWMVSHMLKMFCENVPVDSLSSIITRFWWILAQEKSFALPWSSHIWTTAPRLGLAALRSDWSLSLMYFNAKWFDSYFLLDTWSILDLPTWLNCPGLLFRIVSSISSYVMFSESNLVMHPYTWSTILFRYLNPTHIILAVVHHMISRSLSVKEHWRVFLLRL